MDFNEERRVQPDRRAEPTRALSALVRPGRRMGGRRSEDRRKPYFVDRFSSAMLACVLLLVAGSLVAAIFTWPLLGAGAEEVNPMMDIAIHHGAAAFLAVKYALTVVGLPLLLIFKNHFLFGTRVRVGHLIPAVAALYIFLIGYQIVLMRAHGIG